MKRRLFRFKIIRWLIRKFKLVVLPAIIIFLIILFNSSLRFSVTKAKTPITQVKTQVATLLKEPQSDLQALEGKSAITLTHRTIGEDTIWRFVPTSPEEYQKYLRLVDLIDSSNASTASMSILGAYRVSLKSVDSEIQFSFSESLTDANPPLRNFVRLMKQFGKREEKQ